MSTTLYILVNRQNVIGWQLELKYMQTPPTHYFLGSSRRAAYMKTHFYNLILVTILKPHAILGFDPT